MGFPIRLLLEVLLIVRLGKLTNLIDTSHERSVTHIANIFGSLTHSHQGYFAVNGMTQSRRPVDATWRNMCDMCTCCQAFQPITIDMAIWLALMIFQI